MRETFTFSACLEYPVLKSRLRLLMSLLRQKGRGVLWGLAAVCRHLAPMALQPQTEEDHKLFLHKPKPGIAKAFCRLSRWILKLCFLAGR